MVTYSTQSPSAPLPSSNPTSVTPPSRSARRRGLSYLRSYTQSHLSSSSNQTASSSSPQPSIPRHGIFRSISYPTREQTSESELNSAVKPGEGGQEGASQPADADHPAPAAVSATGQAAVNTALVGISRLMARNRTGATQRNARKEAESVTSNLAGYPQDQMPTIRLIPHQDPRAARPSLAFPPTSRTLPHEDCVIRVGRYSERDSHPNPPTNIPSSAPVGFKSKVVSRRHCEFWCSNGQWYIKDVKSSSGTFLNHIRLSQPSVESRPWPVNDGDVVQLGIDFRGGEEMIFRCVKIRVECNRAWQKSLNTFNISTHKRLRDLGKSTAKKDIDGTSTHSSGTECSICLMSIAPCQSLFVAPCSHVWHFKCIRPILNDHKTWPQFLCPNCRAVADLEADVDDPDDAEWEDDENEDLNLDDVILSENNGTNGEHTLHTTATGGEAEAAALSGNLSVRTGTGTASSLLLSGQPSLASTDRANAAMSSYSASDSPSLASRATNPSVSVASSSIINRRNASRMTTNLRSSENLASSFIIEEPSSRISNLANYLRPITPTQPTVQRGNVTPNRSPSTLITPPPGGDLATDGPLTPTNNAGPFVFDGSAGRVAGCRTVASLIQQTEGAV